MTQADDRRQRKAADQAALPEAVIRAAVGIVLVLGILQAVGRVAAEVGVRWAAVLVLAVAAVLAAAALVAMVAEVVEGDHPEAAVEEEIPATTRTDRLAGPATPDKETSRTPIRVIPLMGASRETKDKRQP